MSEVNIVGMGLITPIGTTIQEMSGTLRNCNTNYREKKFQINDISYRYPIATTEQLDIKSLISTIAIDDKLISKALRMRSVSVSSLYAVYTALQAWTDAMLTDFPVDLSRVAIVSAGSNTQQATTAQIHNQYKDKLSFINPNYGLCFFDTDIIGILSELLGIKGEGHSIGAASASGNMAIIQGRRLIESGEYDLVLVTAPLMELSVFEYEAFTNLGAMAKLSDKFDVNNLCRPFDKNHSGFVYGQSAGSLVMESASHAQKRGAHKYGSLCGHGIVMDSNRNPNPSVDGESKAMLKAIYNADLVVADIDYVNTHGTSAVLGDTTEIQALLSVGLGNAKCNSTKSLIGHSLSSAGLVECIISLIQMNGGFVHGNHNLHDAINSSINWAGLTGEKHFTRYALSNSFAFGGLNTSIVIKNN